MEEIVGNRLDKNRVELVLSQIEKVIATDAFSENYEDCAKLRDIKVLLNQYLKKELSFYDINENLLFAEKRLSIIMHCLFNKAEQNRMK